MTAGALLSHYTTPAERLRGAVFAEGFESYAAVIQNGGVFTGATPPVVDTSEKSCAFSGDDRLIYLYQILSVSFSVELWFRTASLQTSVLASTQTAVATTSGFELGLTAAGNITFQFGDGAATRYTGSQAFAYANNTWHHVVASMDRVNNLAYLVVDGVALVNGAAIGASTVSIGTAARLTLGDREAGTSPFTGSIRGVKCYTQSLVVAEAQQLYVGNVYSYRRRTKIDLPMGIAQHDPANSRTLEVSGNNLHGIQGAAPDVPTKILARRGYYSDGNDFHLTPVTTDPTVSTRTMFVAFGSNGAIVGARYFCVMRPNVGLVGYWGLMLVNGIMSILHNSGGALLGVESSILRGIDQTLVTVSLSSVTAGASTGWYIRDFNAPVALAGILRPGGGLDCRLGTNALGLGTAGGGGPGIIGNQYGYKVWDEQLSPIQIYDLHAQFKQQLNRV